jgi:hypothetical protein
MMTGRLSIAFAALACFLLHLSFSGPGGRSQYAVPRDELEIYANARTVLDASPEELFQRYPDLKKTLKIAQDQDQLEPLLKHVGERTADFFRNFRDTSSVENVVQQMTDTRGMGRTNRSRFMYLMLGESAENSLIEEYRADEKGKQLDLQGLESGFLLASKLVAHVAFFLPRMQPECGFRYLGTTENPKAHVIAFAQKSERPTIVGTFLTSNGLKILLYQGVAWIDPSTYQVLRMRSDLLAPRPDTWLDRQTTDVEFQEVRFPDERTLWLPREARIEAVYLHVTYRNRHRYSEYKRFTVESKDEIKRPTVPPVKP